MQSESLAVLRRLYQRIKVEVNYRTGRLKCCQRAIVSYADAHMIVPDLFSDVDLSLGRFTLYYRTTCTIGPKECCVDVIPCLPGHGMRTPIHCDLHVVVRDGYDFDVNGQSALEYGPYIFLGGWLGRPFTIHGEVVFDWNRELTSCMD